MKKTLPPIASRIERHHLFLASKEKKYNYGDLFSFSMFFKKRLEDYEVSAERPLGLHAESSDALVFIIAACWLNNTPFVPLSTKTKRIALEQQIKEVGPELIITSCPDSVLPGHIPSIGIDRFVPAANNVQIHSSELTDNFPVEKWRAEEIFGYFFTSGTSDNPKIVPLKRRQMHAAAKASEQNLRPAQNESWLLCLPLYHIGGISVILRSLLYGSAIYRMDRFDVDPASKLLSRNKQIVAASLVPTMLSRLLDDPYFATHPAFRAILLGGGPTDARLLSTAIQRNIPVISSYGMTETCAQIAANPLFGIAGNPTLLGSVGKVFFSTKIEIRNSNNKILPPGKSGTIWLKGPQIFDGYLHTPAHHVFDESNWFKTNDFGHVDNENWLYIEARRTDLIITGGENVSPVEIETILNRVEFVEEAAVFGVPDPEWGQKVIAAVVLARSSGEPLKTIQKKLEETVEPYKHPKKILVLESLPRTETGKIKRAELCSRFKSRE